jgi:hypothetical protein
MAIREAPKVWGFETAVKIKSLRVYTMTKKVLIIGLNYDSEIALTGRITIAQNAKAVFISDYGILEENIVFLTDESGPVSKDQIVDAIQSVIDESSGLEELYVYYAGYGSGIRIIKSTVYPTTAPITIDLSIDSLTTEPLVEPITIDIVEPILIDPSIEPITNNPCMDPIKINIIEVEPEILPIKCDFYKIDGPYDKLEKRIVSSDYNIIEQKEILDLLGKSGCRTICVLDMCTFDNESNIMWGTDIIGNVNIISFSESDVYSSGKKAMIKVITSHIYQEPV